MNWNPFAARKAPRRPPSRIGPAPSVRIRRMAGPQNRGRTTPADVGSRGVIHVPVQQAGVKVTHESALGLPAVWACIRVISEDIAKMPWRVMGLNKAIAAEHPADWLIYAEPNEEITAFTLKELLLAWALSWGNGYGEITRDRAGRVGEIWTLEPDRVEPDRTRGGRLVYDVWNGGGQPNTVLEPKDVFHLKGLGYDGLKGYSVIEMHRRAISLGLAQQQSATSTFGNNGVPAGIVQYKTNIDPKVAADTKREWNTLHGGPANRGRIAVLAGDVDFKPITMPLQDQQFVESSNLSTEEICRIYRTPPHKVQHLLRSTNNNIEHQSIEYVQDTLMPWAVRLEQEGNRKLIGRNQRSTLYTKINLNSLLRGDSAARSEYQFRMLQMGKSINEIFDHEDMPTIGPDGDKRFVPANLVLLDKAGEEPAEPTQVEPSTVRETDLPLNLASRFSGKGNGHVHSN